MDYLALALLLCCLLGITLGKPVKRVKNRYVPAQPALPPEQQLFSSESLHHRHGSASVQKPRLTSHLDAAPNSVGVLFTNTSGDEEEVVHVWLPLGRRVFTRDSPELPLHPVTARITTMIRSTPQIATPEHLDRVVCDVFPKYNRTMENQNPEAVAISVSRADELVRLVEMSKVPWREIEAYECA